MKSPALQVFFIVGIAILAAGGFHSLYKTISERSLAVVQLQNKITVESENAKRIAAARTALVEIATEEERVQHYFVPETEIVSFTKTLESRGEALTAVVTARSVSVDQSLPRHVLVFELSVEGTFEAVMRTLGSMEYSPYALSVENFSIQQENGANWRATMKASVGSVSLKDSANTL